MNGDMEKAKYQVQLTGERSVKGVLTLNTPITDVDWVKHNEQQGVLTLKIPAKKAEKDNGKS
jgi:hypothetical protein